ncbi:conserved exported protein of unknown function [Nitrospira japonica]|uniref:Alpha/beta hydrolase n=1 Tax=Nitrospira japonica TaxID=1325564 RepID=A0A1W1I7G3_9BACT|nr:alpha/beta hydrolase [Nitrospira japonica]SLM48934.1 conserved exported protein of unknown function [Nitrospira japonica]
MMNRFRAGGRFHNLLAAVPLTAAALVAGCTAADQHMMPTPMLYKDPRIELSHLVPLALRSPELPVFYATNRKPVSAGSAGHYSATESETVTLGVADVKLGKPGWDWNQLVASDLTDRIDKPRPARVHQVREFGSLRGDGELTESERAFVAAIDEHLALTRNQDLTLYVHGYRVTFDEVSVLMASFARYLGHSATISFQWPTNLYFWNYLTDCPRALKYIPHIERLIELATHTRAVRLNLVAYSCGSPMLAEALVRLRGRYPDEGQNELQRRFRIGNVIFAASDLDVKTFARDGFPSIRQLATQIIVYVSRNDEALAFSAFLARTSRVGRPDVKELTREELDAFAADSTFEVIDVTDVNGAHELHGMKGHGYWFANDWVSSDVTISMRYPVPAQHRCLKPGSGHNVWLLPDDYQDCLVKRLLETYPVLRPASPP